MRGCAGVGAPKSAIGSNAETLPSSSVSSSSVAAFLGVPSSDMIILAMVKSPGAVISWDVLAWKSRIRLLVLAARLITGSDKGPGESLCFLAVNIERMDAGVRVTGEGGLLDVGVNTFLKVGEAGLPRKEPLLSAVGVVLVGVGVERAGMGGFLTSSGFDEMLARLGAPMPKPNREGGGRRVSVSAPLVRSLLGRTGSEQALYRKGNT